MKGRKRLEIVAVLSILTLYIGSSTGQDLPSRKFGESCATPENCDPNNTRLSCMGGFCRCSSDYEIFDLVREQCALKEGERCSPPKFLFGENNPCVSNADCNVNKRVCECAGHAYSDGSGRCLRKKFYNETCFNNNQCDYENNYLSCVEGKCSCKVSTYDEYHQKCRRLVGESCIKTRDCVANAECDPMSLKCSCKNNFTPTALKTCGLSYGESCGNNMSCSDTFFACVNGECLCKNPSYEVYDNSTQSCMSLVGGLCNLFLPSRNMQQPLKLKNCIQNADCVQRRSSSLSQCECISPFVETLSGHCNLPYGAVCVVPGNPQAFDCVEPLTCRDMICQCQEQNQVYDPDEKICKRIVPRAICSSDNDCNQNSHCVKSNCICRPGFLTTIGGCVPEYGNVLHHHQPPISHNIIDFPYV